VNKWVIVIALIACKKNSVDCSEAITRYVAFQLKALPIAPAQAPKLEQVAIAHCEGDGWSDGIRACFAVAANAGELAGCFDTLTKDQQDHWMKDVMPVVTTTPAGSAATPSDAGT
jgi:hypothetical protein